MSEHPVEFRQTAVQPKLSPHLEHTPTISSLPLEILEDIFLIIHNLAPEECANPVAAVMQVSSLWRRVAIELPSLWCKLIASPPWPMARINTYLSRSYALPVSWEIIVAEDGSEGIGAFCDTLVASLRRCRSLSISMPLFSGTPVVTAVMGSIDGLIAPRLEAMTIQLDFCDKLTSEPGRGNSDLPIITLGAPSLSYLRLSGFAVNWCRPSLSDVTTLHLSRGQHPITHEAFRSMLECCPLLSTLAVYDNLIPDWPDDDPDTFRMDRLQSLQLFGNIRFISPILCWLEAPNLADVVIAPVVTSDLEPLENYISTGGVSPYTSVQTLTLVVANNGACEVLTMASSCFPNVTQLLLPTVYRREFEELLTDPTRGVIWPELQTLSLQALRSYQDEFINSFVTHRKAEGYPLTTIHIDASSAHAMPRLEWLKSEVDVEWIDDWFPRQQSALYKSNRQRFLGNPSSS